MIDSSFKSYVAVRRAEEKTDGDACADGRVKKVRAGLAAVNKNLQPLTSAVRQVATRMNHPGLKKVSKVLGPVAATVSGTEALFRAHQAWCDRDTPNMARASVQGASALLTVIPPTRGIGFALSVGLEVERVWSKHKADPLAVGA